MRVIKSGDRITFYSDNLQTFDKIPAGFYTVSFQQMMGWSLVEAPKLEIKEKVYGVNQEKVDKVLRSFGRATKNLGVILSGDKGIGKSLTAKMIAIQGEKQGYPVITVGSYIPGIAEFLNSIEQEVIVLFDEFDKTFGGQVKEADTHEDPQTEMLSLFDGLSSGKKLFIITCNELRSVSSYMVNRPGRFHYHLRFGYPDAAGIKEYLSDKNINDAEINKVIEFSHKVKLNYDCLHAIAFELEDGSHFEDIIDDLNIINLNAQTYNIILHFADGAVLRDTERIDLFSGDPVSINIKSRGVWDDIVGWLTFAPNQVAYINGKEQITAKDCKWEIDNDVIDAAKYLNKTGDEDSSLYTKEEEREAASWVGSKLDYVEFHLAESARYTYTV